MPTGDISVATMGTPWPLAYGFCRATGMRKIDFSVPAAIATPQPADMQLGIWDLGEGELDGPNALWINNVLQFAYDRTGNLMGQTLLGVVPDDTSTSATLTSFSFHTGCDSPAVGSSETQQMIDPIFGHIGNLVTPLAYSRRCYYAIAWTPATSDNATMAPVLDFRGMRCRIFDADGNMTGYRFTTNPIWHFVDLWIRRAIKPEYAITQNNWADDLTVEEAALFNWPSIDAAAQYCDDLLANGLPRFAGSYVFASGSTLGAMLEQVLLCCRGYQYEYAGQICVAIDQPRASTFTITAKHLAGGSLNADQSAVNQGPNRFIAQFLELGLPAVAAVDTIDSIPGPPALVKIVTVNENPCAVGDIISVGGVDPSSLDGAYSVSELPSGAPLEIDCGVATAVAVSGTGGFIGYIQSRFSRRTPELSHRQHQIAQGQILLPTTPGVRLKRIKVTYDFASMTYDQAMRLLQYEAYRELGIDWLNARVLDQVFGNLDLLGSPYRPPWQFTLSLWSESVDDEMRALKAQQVGDVVTLDQSVDFERAGDYEIIAKNISHFQQEVASATGGSFLAPPTRQKAMNNGTDQGAGVLQLTLRTFDRSAAIFTDVSLDPSASFATVPGDLPYAGNSGGSGFRATSGRLTLTTAWQDLPGPVFDPQSSIEWTTINIVVPPGIVLSYPAHATGGLTDDGGGWCFYIDDSTFSGALSCVKFEQTVPTPGPGVFILAYVSHLPTMPPLSGQPPEVNIYGF